MTEPRTVTCSRCGNTRQGLANPPVSGEVGQLIYDHVCQECWGEWFEQQIMVINHYGLNPAIREHRLQLYEVMKEFFGLAAPG
jgi:Fe-S cluster biosynthesis and repair protein YggX